MDMLQTECKNQSMVMVITLMFGQYWL